MCALPCSQQHIVCIWSWAYNAFWTWLLQLLTLECLRMSCVCSQCCRRRRWAHTWTTAPCSVWRAPPLTPWSAVEARWPRCRPPRTATPWTPARQHTAGAVTGPRARTTITTTTTPAPQGLWARGTRHLRPRCHPLWCSTPRWVVVSFICVIEER